MTEVSKEVKNKGVDVETKTAKTHIGTKLVVVEKPTIHEKLSLPIVKAAYSRSINLILPKEAEDSLLKAQKTQK